MAFKMRGWSPFNQGIPEKDIVSELEEEEEIEQSKKEQWVEKSKEASDVLAERKKASDVMGSISFDFIEEKTNAPKERIQDLLDKLKAEGKTPTTQQIIDHILKRGFTPTGG